MKTRVLIAIIALGMLLPPVSHGFGLFRYTFDAVANQLGLDRGPAPKLLPKIPFLSPKPNCDDPRNPRRPRFRIQAEGF